MWWSAGQKRLPLELRLKRLRAAERAILCGVRKYKKKQSAEHFSNEMKWNNKQMARFLKTFISSAWKRSRTFRCKSRTPRATKNKSGLTEKWYVFYGHAMMRVVRDAVYLQRTEKEACRVAWNIWFICDLLYMRALSLCSATILTDTREPARRVHREKKFSDVCLWSPFSCHCSPLCSHTSTECIIFHLSHPRIHINSPRPFNQTYFIIFMSAAIIMQLEHLLR